MAATLRSLDTVLGLKRRRMKKLEEQAAQQAQHVKACEAQLEAVEERKRESEANERRVADAIESMSTRTQGFFPSDLITLQHVLATKVDETKAIVKQVKAAEQQLEDAREAVRQTRRHIDKAKQQLDQLGELRDKLALEVFLAAEDVVDEESEEASVARLVAAAREALLLESEREREHAAESESESESSWN